jgi:hypothetical protein
MAVTMRLPPLPTCALRQLTQPERVKDFSPLRAGNTSAASSTARLAGTLPKSSAPRPAAGRRVRGPGELLVGERGGGMSAGGSAGVGRDLAAAFVETQFHDGPRGVMHIEGDPRGRGQAVRRGGLVLHFAHGQRIARAVGQRAGGESTVFGSSPGLAASTATAGSSVKLPERRCADRAPS